MLDIISAIILGAVQGISEFLPISSSGHLVIVPHLLGVETGLAFDVGSVTSSYGVTPAGKWLAKNCHKYGFIIRYPQGKSDITGYIYEPWHIRYLGVENATKVYESGLTLEEYLGVD